MILGYRMKELRNEKNLSQKELSQILGVSMSTIAMIETGRRELSYPILIKVADYFGVTTDYLLGRSENTTFSNNLSSEIGKDQIIEFVVDENQLTKINNGLLKITITISKE